MLIEVKVRVTWIIDSKYKKTTETFLIDREVFAQAEYTIMHELTDKVNTGLAFDFYILSLKMSPIKEVCTQFQGENTFIASLRDTFLQDDDSEKVMRYKILLWANDIADAMAHTREIASQGYDMQIDSLKEVNYTYLNNDEESTTSED
jgi:hypothetical protein